MAIRRRRTSRVSPGSGQRSNVGGSSVKAMQNTIWDYLIPGIPLSNTIAFDLTPYTGVTGDVTLESVLGMLGTGDFQTCSFPVYPRVGLNGLLIRTNIPDFTQYADVPISNIPTSLAETIEVASDKAKYIGCDNGSGNISQSGLRIKTTPKINSIASLSENEVLISLDIFNYAQNVFVNQNNEPFFPHNESVAAQDSILVPIDSYLNNGQIAATGVYARHLPSAKNTSKTSISTNFDFSLG
jgi:hypothetical protein|tara:strand:- start:44321 stop:45043 length:723 start_codon:yes stop_codon:yes gene_type:complete